MIEKLSKALTVQNATLYEAFSKVFENPNDVVDFYRGCRDYSCLNSFLKKLDTEYEILRMLNQNAVKPLDMMTLLSKTKGLWVNCKLKPEYIPQKQLPTITPTKHYCNYDEFRKLYPNADRDALMTIINFVLLYEKDSPKGSALLKSFNRQLNDGDAYIVLRIKDDFMEGLSHKLLIKKSDLI